MGPLLHSSAIVHEPIEMSFGVVSGVGRGIDVWNGGQRASRGRQVSEVVSPHWPIGFNGVFLRKTYSTRA